MKNTFDRCVFSLPFRLLNIGQKDGSNNRSEMPICRPIIRLVMKKYKHSSSSQLQESESVEEAYKLLVKDGPKELF